MPNWCSTRITIQHPDKAKLEELADKIREWTSSNAMENGFGTNWLGNVVLNAGIGTVARGGEEFLRCRGTMEDLDVDENQINILTVTAYAPLLQMWLKVLEKYLPDATLKYVAEEWRCCLYWTNDETLAGTHFLDFESTEPFSNCNDMSEGGLVKLFQENLGTTEDNLEMLIEMAKEKYPDTFWVHKWEYVPADEIG